MLAAALAADQGTAVRFAFPHEPGLVAVDATWRGRTVPLVRDGDWATVLGVDLDEGRRWPLRHAQIALCRR